jgi:hypothetical protein
LVSVETKGPNKLMWRFFPFLGSQHRKIDAVVLPAVQVIGRAYSAREIATGSVQVLINGYLRDDLPGPRLKQSNLCRQLVQPAVRGALQYFVGSFDLTSEVDQRVWRGESARWVWAGTRRAAMAGSIVPD